MIDTSFGNYIKALRIKSGLPLRKWCQRYGFSARWMSLVEHGLKVPGIEVDLVLLAKCLYANEAETRTLCELWHDWHKPVIEEADVLVAMPAVLRPGMDVAEMARLVRNEMEAT